MAVEIKMDNRVYYYTICDDVDYKMYIDYEHGYQLPTYRDEYRSYIVGVL